MIFLYIHGLLGLHTRYMISVNVSIGVGVTNSRVELEHGVSNSKWNVGVPSVLARAFKVR